MSASTGSIVKFEGFAYFVVSVVGTAAYIKPLARTGGIGTAVSRKVSLSQLTVIKH